MTASDSDPEDARQYYGIVVMVALVLGIYAWASGQSLFGALNGVLPL